MKLVEDIDCPHCKKQFTKETDLDSLEHTEPIQTTNPKVSGTAQILETIKKEPEKSESEIKIETVAPKDEPFFECKNGNCGEGLHRNKNYSKAPNQKCKNCDSLNGSTKCKNCGNKDPEEFEELEIDELKELGIPIPEIKEHEHTHED